MSDSSSPPPVEEAVRRSVPDWDDDVASTARFKALSGQRSDWEPRYRFWRDLILDVARHLDLCTVRSSEVKNLWFARRGLTPLCIDRVLREMHTNGDIILRGDLIDPTSGRLYRMLSRVGHMIGISKSASLQENFDDSLILKPILQEQANDVINMLTANNWTSNCVITMGKFERICKGSDKAFVILGYLSGCGKAQYFSTRKKISIEGVKVSLVAAPVPSISSLDYDSLHLTWTIEELQKQLDAIDRRSEVSRKMALTSLKSGNKQASYRHIRQFKLFSESRAKCTSLLERVEEVLDVIANAESTKKVSEAIKIGARAIKDNRVNVEEVYVHLQELDDNIASQKQVSEALESMPLQSVDIDDEDLEEELKKLEVELADEATQPQMQKKPVEQQSVVEQVADQEPDDILNNTMSKLSLEAA